MKCKFFAVCVLAAGAVFDLAAMPSQEDSGKAAPIVRKLMAPEWMAFKSGKKTRCEVAEAALRLARESDTEAAKLLLMKGAFALYVKDGQTDKAVETMNAIETTIADLPPQSVTNMIEFALLGLPNVTRTRLYQRFDATKAVVPSAKNRTTIQSIIDGMIKVPGRAYWLSETELTQGQWEAVMGYNLSAHKGANLPVENVSHDDCDVFIEKLNQTKEVQSSQFEFCLPTYGEWGYAAQAGASGNECWVKPGVVGDILDMAWVKENSSNQTHAVAMKSANAFGFYDMLGNVWEWVSDRDKGGSVCIRGRSMNQSVEIGWGWFIGRYVYFGNSNHRENTIGFRVAAHIRVDKEQNTLRPRPNRLLGSSRLLRSSSKNDSEQKQATVDGYTWSYRVNNGEATIEAKKDGKFVCAVSPNPTGDVTIPSMLNGVKVTSIGQEAFCHYSGPKSVKIPEGVKSIGWCAFFRCTNLTAVTLPKSLRNIGHGAFADCSGLTSVAIPEGVTNIEADAFRFCRGLKSVNIPSGVKHIKACTFDLCDSLTAITISDGVESFGRAAFYNCKTLGTLSIPSSVTNICEDAFGHCHGLKSVRVDESNPVYKCENGLLMTKDGTTLIRAFNVAGHVAIPSGVIQIKAFAFCDICPELTSVTIPQSVTSIGAWAFANCGRITSITIPNAVTDIGDGAFYRTRIKSVTIPQNVKSIGKAFVRCEALESVTISSGLTNIAISAFSGCSELKSFYVDSGNVCFSSENGLLCSKDGAALIAGVSGDVTIPSGVASIGPCAFGEIHKLRTLTIPASVTNISDGAFKYVARPFYGLELTTVTMHGEIPKMIGSNAFSNCPKLTAIHVPANAKSWAGMKEWQGKRLVFDAKTE